MRSHSPACAGSAPSHRSAASLSSPAGCASHGPQRRRKLARGRFALKTLLLAVFCIVAAHADEKQQEAARRAAEAALQAKRAADARETQRCPADQAVVRVVDLDRPGALAALKETN